MANANNSTGLGGSCETPAEHLERLERLRHLKERVARENSKETFEVALETIHNEEEETITILKEEAEFPKEGYKILKEAGGSEGVKALWEVARSTPW
jgi:hypothetical protein